MKIIRKSATRKFIIFILLVGAAIAGTAYYAHEIQQVKTIPLFLAAAIGAQVLLVVFFGFYWLVGHPLGRIAKQVQLLLTGKKYRRLRPVTIDEAGMITHFFNQITRNLENISGDILTHKQVSNELSIARDIQRDILPKKAPDVVGIDVVARTKSASEVGGDSFDFIETDKGTLIYIGDVTGHGVPAGLIMTMANALIRVFSGMNLLPKDILARTNKTLYDRISGQRFMTMVMMRWNEEEQKLYYTGAGHEYILVYRAKTREIEMVKSGGIALRMIEDVDMILEEKELVLEENDVALLYTDGINEARNKHGEMYDMPRFKESFQKHGHKRSSEQIFDAVTKDFADFIEDAEQEDDITMIIIRRMPEGETSKKGIQLTVNVEERHEDTAEKWSWK